jgi:hypothetical protein
VTAAPRSIPDVAEQLMAEFEAMISISAITEVVLRLSLNGAVSLVALAHAAREELRRMADQNYAGETDMIAERQPAT